MARKQPRRPASPRGAAAARRLATTRSLTLANKELSAELRALRHRQGTTEQARADYAELFDFSPVAYVLLNSVGVILNISMAGCRMLGLDRHRLAGHPLLTFVVPEDRKEFLEHLRRCRTGRGTIESELRLISRTGQATTCRLYSRAALQETAQSLPTLIIDQTETRALDEARLNAEREKIEAERQTSIAQAANLSKDRFLATVSHELRTPLAPALIAATRLSTWNEIPEPARRLAATIKRNIELEARLIDDLLDVARVTEDRIQLRLETVDLHQILRETIKICSPMAEKKDITVTLHTIAGAYHVSGDASRLRQVFWNLLANAIKFAGTRGHVIIRSLNVSDDLIRVTVRDNGSGMDEEILGRLFSPFEHTPSPRDSRSGLGLGLAICKGLVQAHGGQIWASSQGIGQGSTFGVELATAAPDSTMLRAETDAGDAAKSNGRQRHAVTHAERPRVLVIEDDADSSEMLSLFLADEGFVVGVAASLEAGLRLLDDHWDIVVSDIKLPDGSGLDIARQAQRLHRPPMRLIALSGFGSDDDVEASLGAGFDAHLIKPVDLEKLLATCGSPPGGAWG